MSNDDNSYFRYKLASNEGRKTFVRSKKKRDYFLYINKLTSILMSFESTSNKMLAKRLSSLRETSTFEVFLYLQDVNVTCI